MRNLVHTRLEHATQQVFCGGWHICNHLIWWQEEWHLIQSSTSMHWWFGRSFMGTFQGMHTFTGWHLLGVITLLWTTDWSPPRRNKQFSNVKEPWNVPPSDNFMPFAVKYAHKLLDRKREWWLPTCWSKGTEPIIKLLLASQTSSKVAIELPQLPGQVMRWQYHLGNHLCTFTEHAYLG